MQLNILFKPQSFLNVVNYKGFFFFSFPIEIEKM